MGKKEEAAVRRKLHDVLKTPVEEANELYGSLVHLRHGRLEHLAKVPEMIAKAKFIARALKTLAYEVDAA